MRVDAVPGSLRRLALAAGAVASLALAATTASVAAAPSLYFHYAPDCSFSIVDDSGSPVTQLAPGTYQVVVDTPFAFSSEQGACSYVQFDLTGPGVAVTTTLGTGDSEIELFTVTFRPGATYVAQDDGSPARTRRTFTTATTGSPAQVAAGGSGSTSSSTSGKSGTSQGGTASPIGTPLLTLRGTLVGTVTTGGALTLTRNGKPVQILPAGRYELSVVDRSRSSGFTVQAAKGNPIALTTGTFVGKRAKAITLGKGQWLFYSNFVGKKTYFLVTA